MDADKSMDRRLFVQSLLCMEFHGVGRKVADCVSLFSLDCRDSVPVDTHVWDIAVRDYEPELVRFKSLTPIAYEAVGDHFRRRFSPCAGWAHSVLFAAELGQFRVLLPAALQEDMALFAVQERDKKKRLRDEKKARAAVQKEKDKNMNENDIKDEDNDDNENGDDGGKDQALLMSKANTKANSKSQPGSSGKKRKLKIEMEE